MLTSPKRAVAKLSVQPDDKNLVSSPSIWTNTFMKSSKWIDCLNQPLLRSDRGIAFVGSVKPDRFDELFNMAKTQVEKPGDWAGVYSDATKEMFVYVYDTNSNVGKKCCYTTAFRKRVRRRGENDSVTGRYVIPGYDWYNVMF